MEQRKLIRLGNSSFAIALPKDWVEKSGLKKGDEIFVERNSNGEIIISPEFKKISDEKEEVINLDGKGDEEIARDFISAYISGYRKIVALGEKNKIKFAKEIAKSFLNLELIEDSEKKVLFKDLLNIEDISVENFMRRIDNNIKEMLSILSSMTANIKNSKEKIEELYDIDKDITKFYFLIWRLMNMGIDNPSMQVAIKLNPKSFVTYFWLSYNLEQVGDELKRIGKIISKINGDKSYFKEVMNTINDAHSKSMKSFYDKNKSFAKEVILNKNIISKMCDKLSATKGFEIAAEKLHGINANIHNNSKMIFYGF